MPRPSRLTSAADIRRTYSEGKKTSSPTVAAHVRRTGEERPARLGVSAARGIGGAVERNRAKRRLREAVRSLRGSIAPGVDAVLVANRRTAEVRFQELVDSVQEVLRRAGALVG
jgi:ribonuclease P protein component